MKTKTYGMGLVATLMAALAGCAAPSDDDAAAMTPAPSIGTGEGLAPQICNDCDPAEPTDPTMLANLKHSGFSARLGPAETVYPGTPSEKTIRRWWVRIKVTNNGGKAALINPMRVKLMKNDGTVMSDTVYLGNVALTNLGPGQTASIDLQVGFEHSLGSSLWPYKLYVKLDVPDPTFAPIPESNENDNAITYDL